MRVALVSAYDYAHPGGVTEHVRNLSAGLRGRGHEVTVLAPSSNSDDEQEPPDFIKVGRPVPIPAHGSLARISVSLHLMTRIKRTMRENSFDVVHLHEPLMPVLPVTALRYSETFTVGTFHAFARSNIGYYYGKPLLKRYVRRLNVRIAVSPAARDFVQHYFPGDYRIVPNGIDIGRFAAARPIPELTGGRTVLFVGRLESRKGLGYLLRAFMQLKPAQPDLRLCIVGDGPMRRWYANFLARYDIPDVIMAGYVSPADLPRYYASCEVFCAPNTGDESFGIVLLEAMAAGKPIVATDIDGFRTVITAGREGLLVERKSSNQLADALSVLLAHPDLRREMGATGRLTAQRYDWAHVIDAVEAIYRQAPSQAQPIPQRRLEPTLSPN